MNQLFLVNNLINQAEFLPDSVNAQYPAENLKDIRRTKVYRSTTNAANLVLDFGTQRDINIVALVDAGNTGFGFDDITLELNHTNSWATPIYSAPISVDYLNGFAYLILPSTYSVRFARLVITGSAGYCELSKVFIGESYNIGELSFDYPVTYKQNNNASVSKNRLGQRFIDEINTQKEISGNISTMTKEEVAPLMEMVDYASFTNPIWLVFPEGNITTDNDRINGYYFLKDDPTMSFVVGNYWNTSLSFEEGT